MACCASAMGFYIANHTSHITCHMKADGFSQQQSITNYITHSNLYCQYCCCQYKKKKRTAVWVNKMGYSFMPLFSFSEMVTAGARKARKTSVCLALPWPTELRWLGERRLLLLHPDRGHGGWWGCLHCRGACHKGSFLLGQCDSELFQDSVPTHGLCSCCYTVQGAWRKD